ncbi:hypothetical protein Bca101_047839 [Brassica carinata]
MLPYIDFVTDFSIKISPYCYISTRFYNVDAIQQAYVKNHLHMQFCSSHLRK